MTAKGYKPKWVQIHFWEMELPAYRLMSPYGRALVVEFRKKFNGSNNGEIAMAVREAARLLGCHKDTAAKALREVEDKGWIRPMKKGSFHMKSDAGSRKFRAATTWRLTNQPIGRGVETPATKEYVKWRPEI